MPDEAQAPEIPDTPTETPVEDTSPLVDYEARYNNLRPEFDRKSQQLREYEERLAAYEQSQQAEPEYDDGEYEYEDELARRLEQAEARLAAQEQRDAERDQQDTLAAEAEREEAFINQEIELLEKEQDEEFSEEEWNTLGILAERYRDEEGQPDLKLAYEQLFGKIVKPRREKYVSTKKASRPRSGSTAAQSIDLDDPDVRKEYMAQKLSELEGQDD